MRVVFNDDMIIVFLSRFLSKDMDFNNRDCLENKFRDIFMKLSNYYDIDIGGYYEVCAYKDSNYGIILEISKDSDYDMLLGEIDMRIIISKNDKFLYELDDIFDINSSIIDKIYNYKNKYYIDINSVDDYEMGKLLENSNIIYGSEVNTIIRFGNKVRKLI